MKNKFQKWTEEDSKFALKQRLMGKKFSTIANKSYADKLVNKNRAKPKKKVVAKKAVVAPAESVLVNGGLMLTLSVSLAGGILGAALYHYFL